MQPGPGRPEVYLLLHAQYGNGTGEPSTDGYISGS